MNIPLSPSRLNDYLGCPHQAALWLAGVEPPAPDPRCSRIFLAHLRAALRVSVIVRATEVIFDSRREDACCIVAGHLPAIHLWRSP
jgi:hypothetical protein